MCIASAFFFEGLGYPFRDQLDSLIDSTQSRFKLASNLDFLVGFTD